MSDEPARMPGQRRYRNQEHERTYDAELQREVVPVAHLVNPVETGVAQAGAAAPRTTGFSTIGMLINADRMPSRIDSHQTGP